MAHSCFSPVTRQGVHIRNSLVSCTTSLLLLMHLPAQAWKTPDCAHSLCLDLTVKSQSGPGKPWYEAQGSVDQKPVLHYDSDSNKVEPSSPLGEKVNTTKAWTELAQTLGEVGQELRMIMSDVNLENSMTRGPPTLHVQLCCPCEAEQGTAASWHFNINGQPALLFHAMNMTWTVRNPAARGIKEELENKGLANDLRSISMGDCDHWLREFLEHWKEVLEPSVSPTNVPDTGQSPFMLSNAWIILAVTVISSVLTSI